MTAETVIAHIDFFSSERGLARQYKIRYPRLALILDHLYDAALATSGAMARVRRTADPAPSRRILVAGVESPNRPGEMTRVVEGLVSSKHRVETSVIAMGDRGKFANIEAAIAAAPSPLDTYDWLIIVDDDVDFAPNFLDDFVAASEAADLAIAQPAHKFDSYANYRLTHRRWGALVRQTRFVEIGPLTALRRDTFAHMVPFPASRWCYGIDVYWSALADVHGWRMGVVDGAPIRHLRPVAKAYDSAGAVAEGREMLARLGVSIDRVSILGPGRIAIGW